MDTFERKNANAGLNFFLRYLERIFFYLRYLERIFFTLRFFYRMLFITNCIHDTTENDVE